MSQTQSLRPLPADDDTLIMAAEAPAYRGLARQTLNRWRSERWGPPYVKLGSRVAYRAGDLRQWIESRTRRNGAD
jgi:predicted DNA-binding transcriptional regulator AlpA